MTTYAELLEKHAGQKRCQAVVKDGCGQWLPLDKFASRPSKVEGKPMLYAGWCRDCQRERDRARRKSRKTGGKSGVKKDIFHTGPVPGTPEHSFFCR